MEHTNYDSRGNEGLKKHCPISDSELCDWLGKKGCYQCYISTLKTETQKTDALERWKVTLSYLPDNIDDLHTSDECQFCKDEKPEKAQYYATFEMAHPEPYAEKGMILGFGKKVRTPVGSLLTIQAAIGKECKKAFRMADVLQLGTFIGFMAAAFMMLMIPQLGQTMASWTPLMPYIFIALMLVAGYFLGRNLASAYIRKAKQKVKIDLSEIPLIKQMLNLGWFFFQTGSDGMPKVFFHKEKTYDRIVRPRNDEDEDEPLDNINI